MPRPFSISEIKKQTQAIQQQEAEIKAAAAAAGLSIGEYLKAERKAQEAIEERDRKSREFYAGIKAEEDEIEAKQQKNAAKTKTLLKEQEALRKEQAKQQSDQQEAIEEKRKKEEDKRKARMQSYITLVRSAGAIPGVNTLADVASATVSGGRGAGLKTLIGHGVSTAAHGSQLADPATWERLNYQMDRLAAIVGHQLTPAMNWLERQTEKVGDTLGGKGAQLANPQFSDFAGIRDRLQIESLRGVGDTKAPDWWTKENFPNVNKIAGGLGITEENFPGPTRFIKEVLGDFSSGRAKALGALDDLGSDDPKTSFFSRKNFPNVASFSDAVGINEPQKPVSPPSEGAETFRGIMDATKTTGEK